MNWAPALRRCALIVTFVTACGAAGGVPLQVPFFAQKKNGCGAASVAMVMRYWGERSTGEPVTYPSPEEVFQRLYRPELNGIRLADMKGYLEEMGFRVFTLRGRWADVEEQLAKGRPLIVALKKGRAKAIHFAVVAGVEHDRVWLNDPTRTKANRLGRAEFEEQCERADQWMLLATPPGQR